MEPVGEYDNTDVKIKTATFAFAYQETKHEYEFQEVCADLEPYYGKIVWSLAHRVGFTPHKMREAHKIAQKRGITSVGYFIGIIKKL